MRCLVARVFLAGIAWFGAVACGDASVATPADGGVEAAVDADAADGALPLTAVRWGKSAGDGSSQFGYGVAVDGTGNVFIVGEYGGAIDFGAGAIDNPKGSAISGFVTKFDRTGKPIFSRRIGSSTDASAYAVATDEAGHVYVVGWFMGELSIEGTKLVSGGETDGYLIELDGEGRLVFAQRYGGPGSQEINAVAVSKDGIAIAGDFDGTFDLGGPPVTSAGTLDVFVAKLDRDKKHVFSRRYGGVDKDQRPRVAFARDGGLFVAGSYRSPVDLGDGPLADRYDGAFLLRLSATGERIFGKGFVGDGWQFPTGLSVDASGRVAMGGRFTRTVDLGAGPLASVSGEDAWLAVFADDGKLGWSQRFGGFNQDAISGLAFEPSGALWVAGELAETLGPLTSAGEADAFVARFDSKGTLDYSLRFGDAAEQRATKIAIDPLGGAVVVGSFFGAIDAGKLHLGSNGGFNRNGGDAFVISLGP